MSFFFKIRGLKVAASIKYLNKAFFLLLAEKGLPRQSSAEQTQSLKPEQGGGRRRGGIRGCKDAECVVFVGISEAWWDRAHNRHVSNPIRALEFKRANLGEFKKRASMVLKEGILKPRRRAGCWSIHHN